MHVAAIMKKLRRTLNDVLGDATTPQTDALTADDFAAFFQRQSRRRPLIHCYYAAVRCTVQVDADMDEWNMLSPLTRLRN